MENKELATKYFSDELKSLDKLIDDEFGVSLYPNLQKSSLTLSFRLIAFDDIFDVMELIRGFRDDEILVDLSIYSKMDKSFSIFLKLVKKIDEKELKKVLKAYQSPRVRA
ncbi:MAG: hypothetical protein MR902_07665 [Campylobacter sp.]|nr:hypothetical protein [Campylobacter sp.]